MKHFVYLVAPAAACAVFLSCSSSKSNSEAADTADSSDVPELVQVAPEPVDSLSGYVSADLRAFGIKGNVSSRTALRHEANMVYPEPFMALEFDEAGNMLSSLEGRYAKANDDGFNYEYSMNEEDGTSWVLTYTSLDENGHPREAEIDEDGPQGCAKTRIRYSGYSYDHEGNWVMREVSVNREFTDIDTNEKTTSSHSWKEACSYTYR